MKNKIRLGILGGGGDSLIGIVHRIASGMFDEFELVGGCFNPDPTENKAFGKKIGIKEINFNIKNKYEFVRMYMKKNKIVNKQSIFVGNDIQDKKCLEYFQLSLVPKDCNESIKKHAKFVLSKNGGDGAITELANLIFS